MRLALMILGLLGATTLLAFADEESFKLKDAPGRALVELNCITCHSLDYVAMNSPFLDAKSWDAEVHKMIKAYGAPVSEQDAVAIAAYLAANYAKK